MSRVICINPPCLSDVVKHGFRPLYFGKEYEVEEEIVGFKGLGYVLKGVDNSHILVVKDGAPTTIPFSYHSSRFLPLSEIDETELIKIKQLA